MTRRQNLFLDPETILTDQWLMSFSSRGCNFNAPCGNRAAMERDINRFRAKNRFCPLIISDVVMFSFLIFLLNRYIHIAGVLRSSKVPETFRSRMVNENMTRSLCEPVLLACL